MSQPPAAPSSGSASPSGASPPAASPLGASLGLNGGDVALLGAFFREFTASLGLDGGPIFNRLVQGQSIGRALAVPDSVVERLYARAHHWFALGRIDRATELFRALSLLREEEADFWLGYGVCLRLRDEPARAAGAFASAANLRPEWAVPWFHLLELALYRREWPQAREALAAYDARAGDDVPPQIAGDVARLRAALAHGRGEDGGTAPVQTDPAFPPPRSAHEH